jgi:hypothetical protein
MFIQEGIRTGKDVPKQEMERLSILSDTGECLFHLRLKKDGTLEIEGGMTCKHEGKVLMESLVIEPLTHSRIFVNRIEYKE